MGTPPYMAPEQASGATPQVGPLTDVYALGAILYELLTGRPPFQAPTPLEVLSQVLSREPVAPSRLQPRLPRDLETICLKALAKEPARRYSSALALAEDLRRFGAGEPILARRDPVWRKAWRQVRRHRLAYAAALLVALSLGVAALVFAYAREGRRLAAVREQFEGALADVPWDEGRLAQTEALADELDRLRPEEDSSARARLYGAFARSLRRAIDQPNLQPEDVARAEAALTLLEGRDADVARPLREHFLDRLRQWQPLVRLTATSPESPALLGAVRVAGDAFSPPPGRLPTAPLLLRQHDCSGDVRLEAEFGTGWEGVPWLGLALSSAPGSGYAFVLHSRRANPLRPGDGPAALPLAAARAGDGELSLQILRNGVVLRQRDVAPAALAPGPLVLQATREGNRLSVRVNAQPPLEVYDPFPLGRSVPGAFGLYWPDAVGLTRLEAARQTRPVAPSPLERGDELFERKQYAPARDEYRQAAAASTSAAVRQEAAYKEALCHLELGARDEAMAQLTRVAGRKDATAWPLLATAQLWVRLLREKRLAEADALLDRVHEDYPTEIFLAVVPDSVRGEIAATYASAARPRLLFVRPEHLSGFERAVALADLFYDEHSTWPLWGRIGTRGNLARAYHSLGQTQRALATVEKTYQEFGPYLRDQFAPAAYAIVEQYYWLLMARGETQRALEDVTAQLRDLPDTPGGTMYRNLLLVERVRLLAVLGDAREAERQADQFLAEYAAQKPAGQRYEPFAAAHLMLGFLREKRGDPTAAAAVWRDGSFRAWRRLHPQAGTPRPDSPMQLLHNHLVLSLSDDLTDQDVHEIQEGLLASLGGSRAMVRLVEKDLSPSAASAMWRTPTGRGWARRIAFHQLSFAEYTRIPISLAAVETIHQDAFPGGWSKDQEDVAWKTTESCIRAYADGKLSVIQMGQLRQGWQGSIGFLGWGGVRDTLEPSLRAPLAYLFSHRHRALKQPRESEELLRTALQSASPGSSLHRLVQAELAARPK